MAAEKQNKAPLRKRISNTAALVIIIVCFLVTVFPFFIVVINSAKSSMEIINTPIAMPANWVQLFRNIGEVWSSNTVRYPGSLLSSLILQYFHYSS